MVTEEAEIIDSEADTIAKVQAALSESDGESDWLIRISQVVKSPEGTRTGWVFNAEIGELPVIRERIKQECGPGRYRLRVMRDSVPFKQYDLEIIATLADRRAALAPVPAATPAPGIAPEFARLLENQQRQMDQMTQMIAAIANRPAGPTMTDLLAQMKMMSELMPKPVAPDTGYNMFMKALTVAKELVGEGGGGSPSSPLLSIVEKIAPQILDKLPALAQLGAQPQPVPAPLLPPHQPAPLMPVAPATAPQPAEADRLKAYLLGEAAKGTDPTMCADFLQENMPPELSEALLAADDPLALVLQVMPEAEPFKPWFGRLLDAIFEPLEPAGPATQGQGNGEAVANRPN